MQCQSEELEKSGSVAELRLQGAGPFKGFLGLQGSRV